MPRNARLGLVAVLLAGLAAAYWWPRPAQAGPLILISIDTLRADRLPLYGYTQGHTPALDQLARESVVFDRAYAHAPQTLPSHASMLTGLLPFSHGVRDNLGFTLEEDAQTLPERLKAAGFTTAGFVSSYVLRPDTGIAQGFDTYDAQLPAAASDRSPGQVQRPGAETLAAALRWLEGASSPRAFVFFHIYEPHKPYAPPPEFRSGDPYDGEVSASDQIVGRLLDALRNKGWYDDATIVLTADHGEGLGDHGEEEHGLFLYDEVIRVPLLIKQPRGHRGGTRVTTPVQHVDLMPTVLRGEGLALPDGLAGRDLAPLLTGAGSISPQGIYAEALYARYHFGWSELTSLTDERYRYIRAPREELYDLERDPDERVNLATDRTGVTTALRTALSTLTAGTNISAPSAVSDADRQRLAALGYVGTQSSTPQSAGTNLPDPKDKAAVLQQYRAAVDALSAQRFDEGARLLRAILDAEPDMTDVWSQYASTLVRLGRLNDAYLAWREVVARKPDEPSGLLGAAAVLVALSRLDDARSYAELAVAHAPAAAHQALASIALSQDRFDVARQHAAAAEASDPTLPMRAMVDGIIRHKQGDFAAAVPLLQDARARFAQRPIQAADLHYYLGDALARLERYAEAEPMLREELRLYPQNARAWAGLAMLQAAQGRMGDAQRTLDAMLKAAPSPETTRMVDDLARMFGLRK
jgi:arylsulfatase A-like enzyme/predicted Zn-dependent protease